MTQKFANNAASVLASAITNVATSLTVLAGEGARFPLLAGADFFLATLAGLNGNGQESSWEIVKVTARAGDVLTIVRAQESTTAVAWGVGISISARATAATFDSLATKDSPTLTGTPSAPTATAGDNTTNLSTTAFVQAAIALLVNSAPSTLDTLGELAAALGNDANYSTTVSTALAAINASVALKAPLASPALTGTPTVPTATAGTNTTQASSTAFVQAAIAALVNSAPGALDTLKELSDALGSDPNFATTVTNALALKAPLASPALTGVPTAPTATAGTNTTQVATMAALFAGLALKIDQLGGTTGSVSVPSGTTAQRPGSSLTQIRYNSTLSQFEGYNGTAWGTIGGGATGAAGNAVFVETDTNITGDYTITSGKNAMTAGPVTVNNGVTVTIPSGSVWTIV